jgi:hypothetical protein
MKSNESKSDIKQNIENGVGRSTGVSGQLKTPRDAAMRLNEGSSKGDNSMNKSGMNTTRVLGAM